MVTDNSGKKKHSIGISETNSRKINFNLITLMQSKCVAKVEHACIVGESWRY